MQVFYFRAAMVLGFCAGNLFSKMGLALKRWSELIALGSALAALASGSLFGCAMQLPRTG